MAPENVDWKGCGAEYIAEATGKFTDPDGAKLHFEGGAKKVVTTSDDSEIAAAIVAAMFRK